MKCRLLSLALVLALAASACGRKEQAIVDQFFAGSRLRDRTALQKVATVTFEPAVQGIVEQFDITNVSPEENQTKTVTVSAEVKLPEGDMRHEVIVLTMSRGLITGFLGVPFQKDQAPPQR